MSFHGFNIGSIYYIKWFHFHGPFMEEARHSMVHTSGLEQGVMFIVRLEYHTLWHKMNSNLDVT